MQDKRGKRNHQEDGDENLRMTDTLKAQRITMLHRRQKTENSRRVMFKFRKLQFIEQKCVFIHTERNFAVLLKIWANLMVGT